ncbi:hypothetical protein [Lysinibacillus pakistanensis]|uniref:hypothetical protein n=1 Tax=Lysinibacillus pakistanensis TaxID=759811 RepID=UPI003D2D5E0B
MRKRLGCLHAHYSNIAYIEQTFFNINHIELVHFVDPGLILQASNGNSGLAFKVKEQLEWMENCQIDAILITCTNYIALLEEAPIKLSIPILKIDEPFFEAICRNEQPQTILFTNPGTVEGTMSRLQQYAIQQNKEIEVAAKVIDNTFELIMRGKQEAYKKTILQALNHLKEAQRQISVAQLSMVEAAQLFEKESGLTIIHPLKSLAEFVIRSTELYSE